MKDLHVRSLDTLVETRECHSIDGVVSEIKYFFFVPTCSACVTGMIEIKNSLRLRLWCDSRSRY
jgi:hypothetical protein